MYTLIILIHVVVSIFLIITVLLQFGKGASVGSTFGGSSSQTLFGGAGPQTFLGKLTIASAVIFMCTSLYLTYLSGGKKVDSIMSNVKSVQTAPAEQPAKPAAEPGAPAKQPAK
ncbi:MAG: preprotein translocase subunit SecG [Deltaproteobacteria bacterium]